MIKFTSNNDFSFDVESVSLITDPKQLTKRASALDMLKYAKDPKQEDLHIIALGAYEGTGYNRNGDCFLEKDCESNHHFFKKANRAIHRHHKNKPTDPKYGNIKASAYNKPMKRIELIIGLDRDKCADILHEQDSTGNTNWSMASKQAYDICSWCEHKAKTDKDRCEHIPRNIGELDKKGEMCGMINPDPKWFEMSYVHRGADRIGVSLSKAAGVRMLPSDYLNIYTDLYVPNDLVTLSKKASDKRDLVRKLAEIEKHVEAVTKGRRASSKDKFIADHATKLTNTPSIPSQDIQEMRKHDPSKVFRSLADNGVTMDLEGFLKYIFDNKLSDKKIQGVKSHLPGIMSKLDGDNDGDVVNNEKYEPSSSEIMPKQVKQIGSKLKDDHSMFGQPSVARIMRITIIAMPKGDISIHKEKTKEAGDEELAKQYIAYKIAALNYLQENNKLDDDVMYNTIIQNLK